MILALGCVDVHLNFLKMTTVPMVTINVQRIFLNYEFQDIEYQVDNGFSLAEFV
jgi:hypothetical protein